ncbi:MAG: hypothetical protein ACI857_000826 [Arenicella sp.]|jgi:hypothetical protein
MKILRSTPVIILLIGGAITSGWLWYCANKVLGFYRGPRSDGQLGLLEADIIRSVSFDYYLYLGLTMLLLILAAAAIFFRIKMRDDPHE